MSEIDSIRYKLLVKVIDKALQTSIECLSEKNLAECYPSFATKAGLKHLNNSIKQINNFFLKNCEKEVQAIFKEKNIKEKLIQLDRYIEAAQEAQEKGNEEDKIHIESLSRPYLIEYNIYAANSARLSQLEATLTELHLENEELVRELKEENQDNETLLRDVEGSIRDMQALKNALRDDLGEKDQELEEYSDYFEKLARREILGLEEMS